MKEMFNKKNKNIPKNLEDSCNFEPSLDDWALIEEAFVYITSKDFYFKEFLKLRNPREHKRLWKRYTELRSEHGHKLIGFLFMKRCPETKKMVCKQFENPGVIV